MTHARHTALVRLGREAVPTLTAMMATQDVPVVCGADIGIENTRMNGEHFATLVDCHNRILAV